MRTLFAILLIILFSFKVLPQVNENPFTNIQVSTTTVGKSETSISIDPGDPTLFFIGFKAFNRYFDVGYYVSSSSKGGFTWKGTDALNNNNFPNIDPSVKFDANQNLVQSIASNEILPLMQSNVSTTMTGTLDSAVATADNSYNIHQEKPLSISLNIAVTTSIITSFYAGYNISPNIDISISYFRHSAILAYEGEGISVGVKLFLSQQSNFSNYVSFAAGHLAKTERNANRSGGFITATQFGWDYVSDSGFNVFGAIGPILTFVPDESVNGALVLVGLGWRF